MVKDKKIRILAFMQMLLISMLAVSIPALITTFQKVFNLSIAHSAIIPIIGTVGGFITNLLIARISAHVGLKRLNQYFLLLGILTAFLLSITCNIYLFLFGMMLIGINTAFGLSITSTIFAHIKKEYQNYGLFHAFFGIGGIITPAVIGWILTMNYDYEYIYLFLGVIYVMFFVFITFSDLLENRKYESIKFREAVSIIRKKFVLPVLIMIVLEAGSEQGLVTWSGNLFQDSIGLSVELSSFYLSLYWIVFTISRLFTQFFENKFGKLNTVRFSLSILFVGIITMLISNQAWLFMIIAMGVAPVFPLMQKYTAQKLPDREVGLFNGMVFAASSIGNIIIAGSMGLVADFSLRLSYLIPLTASIISMMIILYLSRLKRLGVVSVTLK
jgi:MFS family permease